MNGSLGLPRPRIWPLVIRSLAWSVGCWVVIQLIAFVPPNGPTLTLFALRLFLALSFLVAAGLVVRKRHESRTTRTPAILLALCLALFGIRILAIGVVVLASHGASSEAVSYAIPGLIIFQTTVSGLLGLLATLIGERRALQTQQARALEAERQAAHADRLESLGRLAGGVAHDFNNVLTVIDACTDLALESSGAPTLVREELEELRRASTRGRELTRQLLAYSGRDHPAESTFAPDERVRSVVGMLRRLVGQEITMVAEMEDEVGSISMDPSQFEQVLMNLILNARDAMPAGGAIAIALRPFALDAQGCVTSGFLAPGRYVSISVRDEGIGIPADRMARIFDPFYSTKGPDRGTGLGLATVQAIVMRTGGGIDVESELGHGTTFRVLLPAAA